MRCAYSVPSFGLLANRSIFILAFLSLSFPFLHDGLVQGSPAGKPVNRGQKVFASSPSSAASNAAYASFVDIRNAARLAKSFSANSWEYGATIDALMEVYDPSMSVFSRTAFPSNRLPVVMNSTKVAALRYAKPLIRLNSPSLADGAGAVGDPASLGISAILLGTSSKEASTYSAAARRQFNTVQRAPRFWNGAISQRENVAELWADAMYMMPPFLAYYGVAMNNASIVRQAVDQCNLYRQVLQANATNQPWQGLWTHIVGPQSQTLGIWATGNGWAALGMVRVLAIVQNWNATSIPQPSRRRVKNQQTQQLTQSLMQIFQGLQNVKPEPKTGFLRNYIVGGSRSQDDKSVKWFGDGAGTAALVAAALRLAVLQPQHAATLVNWTKPYRTALAKAVDSNPQKILSPVVNPYDWFTTEPYTKGSPEAQAFLAMAGAAWRDCVQAGICKNGQ